MRLDKKNDQRVPEYPLYRAARGILIGTSITAAMVLIGCSKKPGDVSTSQGGDGTTSGAPATQIQPNASMSQPNSMKRDVDGTISSLKVDRDSDGDGVRDRDDKCPKVKGNVVNDGCPEKKVSPPTVLGKMRSVEPSNPPITTKPKLKDSDGDGIPDVKDACPTRKGPASIDGCPRRRHAGVKPRPRKPRIDPFK